MSWEESERSWTAQGKKGLWDLVSVCGYLMRGTEKDLARVPFIVTSERRRRHRHKLKYRKFHIIREIIQIAREIEH